MSDNKLPTMIDNGQTDKTKTNSSSKSLTSNQSKSISTKSESVSHHPDNNPEKGQWYVINCYSGHEDRVRDDLIQRIESLNMDKYIFDVRIIKKTVISPKTKKALQKNIYPGYVFVNMIMNDEAWYIVRNTSGVTGFIGSSGKGTKPFPLSEREVNRMIHQIGSDKKETKKPVYEVNFRPGDLIKVLSGAFKGREGKFLSFDENNGTVKISMEFFGRQVNVEVKLDECEKA